MVDYDCGSIPVVLCIIYFCYYLEIAFAYQVTGSPSRMHVLRIGEGVIREDVGRHK